MKKILFLVAVPAFLLQASCKNKSEATTADETVTTEEQAAPAAGSIAATPESNRNSRWEARKAKGDTLAMPYKDLQQYLPEINGYTKSGGPKGSQMNMPGMGSWSEAEQEYTNGDKRISIKIVDYNAAWQTFEGVTSLYRMAFTSEDDDRKQAGVDLGVKDAFGYETIHKKDNRAEMAVIVADRFFINVETDGEGSEDFIKDVTKQIPLAKLSAL